MNKQREIEQIKNIIDTTKNPMIMARGVACINSKVIAEHLADLSIGNIWNAIFEFADKLEEKWNKDIAYFKEKAKATTDIALKSKYEQAITTLETCIEDMTSQIVLYKK